MGLGWTGSGLDITGMGLGKGAGPVLVTVQAFRNKPSTANKNQVLDRHFPISRSKNRLFSPIPLMVTSSTLLVYQDRAPSHILHLSDFPINHMAKSPNPPHFSSPSEIYHPADPAHRVQLRFYGFDMPLLEAGIASPSQVLHFVLDHLASIVVYLNSP
jgi:hypothetical protein